MASSARGIVFLFCSDRELWDLASQCWYAKFLRRGSVAPCPATGSISLCLGDLGHTACLAWPLEKENLGNPDRNVFSLATATAGMKRMPWLVVLDPGDWEVIPTKAVSPLHTFLLRERHLGDRMGISLAQCGRPQPMLHWAARHCYWDLGKSQLLQLTTHRGLSCTAKSSLFEIVLELVQDVLKPIGLKELDEILSLRAKLVNTVSSEMPFEVFKEVADEEDHQDAKM